ncbi:enoyl-ACP reductase [Muriicola sp. Z0-33]|uniref:enoyl-ACP reductase FabI n=1 Tax=Muriicola sp. Z0-33 TaxID=2816957 RepID=UPI0022382676|nr:SDR family oxidoreductase [Muriicola sp. Z0-33]MCW5515314.1 SDR family oxidoreductase [Muriicola sp. Z0-33]
MEDNLEKEWALILGGSSGLGLATAKKLAQHGYHLIVIHRDRRAKMPQITAAFEELSSNDIELHSFNVDAVHEEKRAATIEEIERLLKNNGKIKVLVHSIAKGNLKPMGFSEGKSLTNQDFQITLNAMAISFYDWTTELLQRQLFSEDPRVMAFTSEGSSRMLPNYAAVSAAKATLESITRSMAVEFAKDGLKANCIQAGITDTAALNLIPQSDIIKEQALQRNPSGRLTRPEDVANVVYLLCSKEASWITGTVITADGGESLI